ncbi:hypothetical protein COT98_01510 [Candidatus Falkowbacteria bacterium CG10_big_fil_rev_8_21_14_0_10_39_9]|uniref:Double zinc ribbon domain-containing protein n=1 Tax=Candidatus Falkowbacteria bacterium CG10_big_fil_rev_8_21_14_0_10_39_9 TaxID=1974566 RepID=A0A2M6WQB0_9BACT|nr:MAG: hypothetical protein COT98_01510 [Candidatus Falkowbacteria bacterium CG10_big_fil_rev_8_21_14_0_10_39_9]
MNIVLDLFFPKFCCGCKKYGSFLCDDCEADIKYVESSVCIVCQKPSSSGLTHIGCATKYTPEKIYSPMVYKGPVKKIIHWAKYRKAYRVLDPLMELFLLSLEEDGVELGERSVVIPIPLHWRKFINRGFNQSEYIAQKLAEEYKLVLNVKALSKVKNTKSQVGLKKNQRKDNMEGVFRVNPWREKEVRGKDIILFDDVATSHATFLSASKSLKKAGCRYIYCFALAKD